MKRLLFVLALFALALPAAGAAGGFATVQLSSLPAGTDAGESWTPQLTILQHGLTPLDNLHPVVRISNDDGARQEFDATPGSAPGTYDVEVRFPAAGTWRFEIWDGFSQTHTYSPVTIGDGGGASFPTLPVTAGVLGALALAGALLAALRRRRPGPSPALGG